MIDLTNAKVDKFKTYDGANGGKISVIYNDVRYMVKFPPTPKPNLNLDVSYINSCISEHVASSIFNSLGIDTQQTFLANYTMNDKQKLVVACKDFETDGFRLRNFIGIRNACVSSNGTCVELSEVLQTINEQEILSPNDVTQRFWDMFIGDALLGNFDRHNGNWGFLLNEETQTAKLAPVFDCGSCLYPRSSDDEIENTILGNQNEIDQRLYVFPRSALRFNNNKISYHDFLETTDNLDCLSSLQRIIEQIDFSKIESIINDCPISDVRKEFYLTMIRERNNKIIINALQHNPNYYHIIDNKKVKPVHLPPAENIAQAQKQAKKFNSQLTSSMSYIKHNR